MLNRQAIIDAQDLPIAIVDVPEWGGQVRVRALTGAERLGLYTEAQKSGTFDLRVFQPLLVAMTAVDDAGQRLFADDEVAIIAGKSASAVQRVFDASAKHNALHAGAIDELEKNSAPTQNDASS